MLFANFNINQTFFSSSHDLIIFRLVKMQQYFKAVFRIFSLQNNIKKTLFVVVLLVLAYYGFVLAIARSNRKFSLSILELNKIINAADVKLTNKIETSVIEPKEILGVNGCKIIDYKFKQHTVNIDGVQYPKYLFLSQNKSINYECLNKSSPLKKILAWNKFYGERFMGYGGGPVTPFVNKNCPVTNCEVIEDKSKLNEADLVVILMTDPIETQPPRTRTSPKERWVFSTIESPFYHPESYSNWNGFFNYTSDYLIGSDFGINYESQKRFLWALNNSFDENYNFHKGNFYFFKNLIKQKIPVYLI